MENEVTELPKRYTSFSEDFKNKRNQNRIKADLLELYQESDSDQEYYYLKAEYHQQRRMSFYLINGGNSGLSNQY